jgi:flagellar protein FliO/FliZ
MKPPLATCRGSIQATFLRSIQAASVVLSAPAYAQATGDGPSVLPLLLTLAFVIALIPIAVWFLKRLGQVTPGASAGLRVVAQLPLGQRERLVVVEAGERWLVLGVTASSINRVGSLPKGELPALDSATPFSALLRAARGSGDNSGGRGDGR